MLFPQVGHCPSCAAIASVASSRDEQYPQLNPYRLPPAARNPGIRLIPADGGGGTPAPPAPTPAPTATAAVAIRCCGTRSVAEHVGQRTSWPVCRSSALSGV